VIGPGTGVAVYLACGVTDMRKGITGLAAAAQQALQQNPCSGAVFAFRGRRAQSTPFHIPFGLCAGCLPLAPAARPMFAHRPAHDTRRG
jgi:transposase